MEHSTSAEDLRYAAERRKRLNMVLIAIPALAGLLLGFFTLANDENLFYRAGIPKGLLLLVVIGLLGFSGLTALMTYLQTGFKRSSESDLEYLKVQQESEAGRLDERMQFLQMAASLRSEMAHLRTETEGSARLDSNIDSASRAELLANLKAQLAVEGASAALAELKAQVASAYSRDHRDKELLTRFDESRFRLTKELDSLSRRGNLNLSLGAVTTVIGLILLGISVFSELTSIKEMWPFISHFVPRLTLVILIELFAYFFLSLYKASLAEIKYFQNELTNIESKELALQAALNSGEASMISDIVSKLALTERNHILSKDQTTVELERARLEKDSKSEIAKYVAELFQKKT